MTRFTRSAALLVVLAGVLVAAVAAAPTDPPFPARINFPAPTVNPTTGAVTTNFSPEGIAVKGTDFYAPNTTTGGILKGDLVSGVTDPNWIPASPASPDPAHRSALGAQVDSQNRLWMAGNLGATGGATAKGTLFVFNATTGVELAAYKLTDAANKTINDMVVTDTAVWVANTTAPSGAGSEVQFKLTLGPGGSLPPGGEINPDGTPNPSVPAPVTNVPTPGFTGADGIDVLPNGNIIINSVNGASNGQMIVINATTLAVTPVTVSAAAVCVIGQCAPPLLSGDGVTLSGNMLYFPENRTNVVTPPGDIAAVRLLPPNYTTAEIVGRLNSPAGSGLPPLRSPANTEQYGQLVYVITREVLTNPVTGAANVTQTFVEHLDMIPITAAGAAVSAVEGTAFNGTVANVLDPNTGTPASGLTATINWGDGSPTSTGTATATGPPLSGTFTIGGSHTYAHNGSYTVTTTVIDALTSFTLGTTTSTATVADAPITATGTTISGVEASPVTGVVANFHDTNPLGSASNFTATINWGDGTPATAGTIGGSGSNYTVTGTHTYATAVPSGSYTITVNILGDGGATATATSTALIAYAGGCTNAGNVNANAHFSMPGEKQDIHFDVNANCDGKSHGPNAGLDPSLQSARAKVQQGPSKIVDAKTAGIHDGITTVKIVGSTATIVGVDGDNSFVIVVTDGGKGKNAVDTAWVQVKDSSGAVIFDSSTLSAKHSPDVSVTLD